MNELNFAQSLVMELFNDKSGNLKKKIAFNYDGIELSYELFTQASLDYYYYFQQKGVNENSVVGISTSRPMTQQAMLMALIMLGCTSFIVDVVTEDFRRLINPTHIFVAPFENDVSCEKFIADNIPVDIIPHSESGALTQEGASNLLPTFSTRIDDEKICLYKVTSGTTGSPNLVPLTYGTMSERTSPSIISDCDSPVHVIFNQVNVIYVLSLFRNLRRFGETIISNKTKFSEQISRSIVTTPYSALEFCQYFSTKSDSKKVLQLGGGKMNQGKIIELLENYFHKVVDSYGCTECGHIMKTIYTLNNGKLEISQKISDGVEIRAPQGVIADDAGEIGFRTHSMAREYIGDTVSTARYFRDGWFYPGDWGYFGNDSMLHLVGRDSDIVNLGGDKFDLNQIDYILQQIDGVRDLATFTFEHDGVTALGIATVFDTEAERHLVSDSILEKVLQLSDMLKGERVRVYPVTRININQNGKISRHDLKKTLYDIG